MFLGFSADCMTVDPPPKDLKGRYDTFQAWAASKSSDSRVAAASEDLKAKYTAWQQAYSDEVSYTTSRASDPRYQEIADIRTYLDLCGDTQDLSDPRGTCLKRLSDAKVPAEQVARITAIGDTALCARNTHYKWHTRFIERFRNDLVSEKGKVVAPCDPSARPDGLGDQELARKIDRTQAAAEALDKDLKKAVTQLATSQNGLSASGHGAD